MSEPFNPESVSDEILSAYLDGELSPRQMEHVERWLAGSPSARRRLDDFRRLSGLLQELPRSELPSEFASQVLRDAERQMLLPAPAAAPVFAKRMRWWGLAVAAPLTAAALLLVTIHLSRPPAGLNRNGGRPDEGEIAIAGRTNPLPAGGSPTAVSRDETPASMSRARRDDAGVATPAAARTPDDAAAADATGPVVGVPAAAVAENDFDGNDPGESIDASQIGALIRQAQVFAERGQTAVVRLYVVDRAQGMELVQVILEEHQIPREPGAADSTKTGELRAEVAADAASRLADRKSTGHDGLFVVADATRLTAALEALRTRQAGAATWKLAGPIGMDSLDRPSQSRVADALLALGAVPSPAPSARPARSVAESTQGTKTAAKNLAEKPASESANPAGAAEAVAPAGRPANGLATVPPAKFKSDEARPVARQMLVQVSAPPSGETARSAVGAPAHVSDSLREESKQADGDSSSVALSKKGINRAQRSNLVRLILLFESAPAVPPAAEPPAPPQDGAV